MEKFTTRFALLKCSGEEGLSKGIEEWVSKGYDLVTVCWIGNTRIPMPSLHVVGRPDEMHVPNFLAILENKKVPFNAKKSTSDRAKGREYSGPRGEPRDSGGSEG